MVIRLPTNVADVHQPWRTFMLNINFIDLNLGKTVGKSVTDSGYA